MDGAKELRLVGMQRGGVVCMLNIPLVWCVCDGEV